jgi:hypothetical protein
VPEEEPFPVSPEGEIRASITKVRKLVLVEETLLELEAK